MNPPRILSVQVGLPVTHPPVNGRGRKWRSAIVKHPVEGPVQVREDGLDGDKQYDRRHHGGPTRAINVYPSEHYVHWRKTPGLEAMTGGAFGENFTTEGMKELTTCIGDVFQVGREGEGPIVVVTQPRAPCPKLNKRWSATDLMERSSISGRIGWYMGVQVPGIVSPGDTLTLLEQPYPDWSVARVWEIYRDGADEETYRALAALEVLAEEWRGMALARIHPPVQASTQEESSNG